MANPKSKLESTLEHTKVFSSRDADKQTLVATIKTAVFIPTLIIGLIIGLLLVLYPLLPALNYQVKKHFLGYSNVTSALASPSYNQLFIPKIGVQSPILEGPTLKILNQKAGVWHQTGDLTKNLVIAGHRFKYLPPNTTTFYNLDKLQIGDTIVIDWQGQRYFYLVAVIKSIDQHDNAVLAPTSNRQVTIYTCADKQQTQRILVMAKPAP